MNLHKLIFTECDAYKAGRKIEPKGVMVHSTGANNPTLRRYVGPDDGLLGENKYNNHWNKPGVGASVHAFIGKLKDDNIATYQVLPWDCRAGHCASGANGSGNNTHIAFEICEDDLKDAAYFNKVYTEAVELTAMLCKEYNLDPMADGVVICHSEGHKRGIASNHGDVMHWFPKHGKSMDTFRTDVNALLKAASAPAKSDQMYRIRKTWSDASSQIGAYENLENAKNACKAGYTVFDKDGKAVYTVEIPDAASNTSVRVEYAQKFTKSKAGTYRVNASVLNLRAGASTIKPIIEKLQNGAKVECYGYHTDAWLYVQTANGNKGFCHSSYLRKV